MDAKLRSWLEEIGLDQYADVLESQNIDFAMLDTLSDQELRELGFTLGHRKKFRNAVTERNQAALASDASATAISSGPGRRQLTVLFCDLVGFTKLSNTLDLEELQEVTAAFQRCCENIVERFQGKIARYMGDAVLVYFGYPIADEHDSERAVLAALRLSAAIPEIEFGSGATLSSRIGIATGEVVVGQLIGQGASQEHEVVGETPNLAARLQAIATSDTVLISATTRRLAGSFFDCTERKLEDVRGFDGPVTAFEVNAELDVDDRFAAQHPRKKKSTIYGREHETEQLWQCWRSTIAGNAQIGVVVGEAGIGKSRLVHALRDRLATESCDIIQFYGVPFTQQTALYPVISQLQRASGILRKDDPAIKLDKLEMEVSSSGQNLNDNVPIFASLLSIPTGIRYAPLTLSPTLQRERTAAALVSRLFHQADNRPLLIIFEDLHWMDAPTLELIDRLLGELNRQSVMVLLSYRPEFVPPFANDDRKISISLDRLSTDEAKAIVDQVIQGRALPTPVLDHILEKGDGIPLFVEELTKNILESGLLKEEGGQYVLSGAVPPRGLPSTLQDSLMARLDRLGAVKEVAQIGAVIGRHFSYDLVAAVSGIEASELQHALSVAANAELIYPTTTAAETVYSFKHALVQEAAYSSLLRGKSKPLHKKIATVLIKRFPVIAETEPERIARHYTEAGANVEAIPYWLTAGERAGQRAAYEPAISHLNSALDLISDLPETPERDQLEARCQTLLALSLAARFGYAIPGVEEAYTRARMLCQRLGRTPDQFPILSGLVSFYLVRADHLVSDELAAEYVEAAQASEAPEYLIDAYRSRGYTQFFVADLAASKATLENCINLYEKHRDRDTTFVTPENPAVAALSVATLVLWLMGYPDQALKAQSDAVDLAESLGHPFNIAFAHSWSTVLHRWRGDPQKSAEHAKMAMQISAEHGFDAWRAVGAVHLAIAMGELGEAEKGIEIFDQTVSALRAMGSEAFVSCHLHGLAELYSTAGQLDKATAAIEAALEHAITHDEHFFQPEILCKRGCLSLLRSEELASSAEADFRKAIELARQQGARSLELRATICLHKLLLRFAPERNADYPLAGIFATFTEGFDTADLRQAKSLL